MSQLRKSVRRLWRARTSLALVLAACFPSVACCKTDITGAVRNQSRRLPAAGEEVILFRLGHGLREESHARTSARGTFVVHVRHRAEAYLLRVVHQGVAYERRASAGQPILIEVFDSATHVANITGTIEILRAATNGNLLHLSDLYEIKNESAPPLTAAGDKTFEVYLPANARMDSVLAASSDGIGTQIRATAVPGQAGHFTVSFPLRPGLTKFAFHYDLPYDGHAAFQTEHAYPLQQFALMIPSTMQFSSPSGVFEILPVARGDYRVRAASHLAAGKGPWFEISGSGSLPPLKEQARSLARALSRTPSPPGESAVAPGVWPSAASFDLGLRQRASHRRALAPVLVMLAFLAVCAVLIWRTSRARSLTRRGLGF
ncbi:MAG: hypothetical protein ABSG16_22750 [Candidatus Acidiferrum sp.]